jgi:hypothetical protein
MSTKSDLEDDCEDFGDFYEPSPEELEADKFYHSMIQRFPTFYIIHKIANRRARLLRLEKLNAPKLILDDARDLLNSALEDLTTVLPVVKDDDGECEYSFDRVLEHCFNEFRVDASCENRDRNLDN